MDPENRGASRLSEHGETTVPAVRASELTGTIPHVDLVKIDVEGHEVIVFRAMQEELRRLRPRGILFEDQTGEAGSDGAIGSVLTGLGYKDLRRSQRPVQGPTSAGTHKGVSQGGENVIQALH